MTTLRTERVDIDALVKEKFQPYIGDVGDRPLEDQVLADSGLDSVVLVMVLTDLFLQVNLDVGDGRVKLRDLRTLADVATLVRRLLDGEQPSSCSNGTDG